MDLVELLLRYGAAVNVTDIDARTPLMLAARCGNAPLVELFLEYGAKRDMVDNSSKFFTMLNLNSIIKNYGGNSCLDNAIKFCQVSLHKTTQLIRGMEILQHC